MSKNKTVYISLTADTIHHGHINLIENGRKYGSVIIGLLSDKAVVNYKRLPILNYYQRKKILENFKGVSKVIPQNEWDYSHNIKKIKPNYFVHGDDWKEGAMSVVRKNVIKTLNQYGGKLIELPYTKGVSSTSLADKQKLFSTTPDIRRGILKRLLNSKNIVRFIETHNPLSAMIAEN